MRRESDEKTTLRYEWALVLLLASYLLGAVDSRYGQFTVEIIYIAILAILVFDREAAYWVKGLALSLVVLSGITSVAFLTTSPPDPVLAPVSSAFNAVVVGMAIVIVIKRIATHKRVTRSTVIGALLVYALLGFMFAAIYQTVALVHSEPFFNEGYVTIWDYSYFSFITLTTLGFGDLTPALDVAKRLVVIEALLGQILLVVLVARLVSMWGSAGPWANTEMISPDEDDD